MKTIKLSPPKCPYCDSDSVLADSAEVYGGKSYGPIYLCRPCKAWVGCHKGTSNPLGRLANAELRKWKMAAHSAFDPLWKTRKMRRRGAYKWLSDALGILEEKCHIGMFDVDLCKKTVEVCKGFVEKKRIKTGGSPMDNETLTPEEQFEMDRLSNYDESEAWEVGSE